MTMSQQVTAYKEDLDLFSSENEKMEYILDFGHDATSLDPVYITDESSIKGWS